MKGKYTSSSRGPTLRRRWNGRACAARRGRIDADVHLSKGKGAYMLRLVTVATPEKGLVCVSHESAAGSRAEIDEGLVGVCSQAAGDSVPLHLGHVQPLRVERPRALPRAVDWRPI